MPVGSTVKERPILFSASMVNALLAGRKTQTRRVVKLPCPLPAGDWYADRYNGTQEWGIWQRVDGQDTGRLLSPELLTCPYGQPGDRLWVQENHRIIETAFGTFNTARVEYAADGVTAVCSLTDAECQKFDARSRPFARHPGRFMYRSLSRLTLEITEVRVERLHAISEADAQAEGARRAWERQDGFTHYDDQNDHPGFTYRNGFHSLWCDINGEPNWDANPFVWVVTFKVVTA